MTKYTSNGFTITINKNKSLPKASEDILRDRYMAEGEEHPQEVFARAACNTADDSHHAQRLYDYCSELWFMFSTPILSNAGTEKGLPISCFLGVPGDSVDGLLDHYSETAKLATFGGGTAGDWSFVRSIGQPISRGGETPGIVPFLKTIDSGMAAFHQGSTRRGSYAAYLDVRHPEIEEFLNVRDPQGDPSRKCLGRGFHIAVNIPDKFMRAVQEGSEWSLTDPHHRNVVKTVSARELWLSILHKRLETGEPYLHFIDQSNRQMPQPLKDLDRRINSSNLCSEIVLSTSPDRTAVCCLSSVNLEKWDEWKDHPWFIDDLMRMLDNVLTIFIENSPPSLWRAPWSAITERSVGLGAMGYHALLQQKNLPWNSKEAKWLNMTVFEELRGKSHRASQNLAEERGEPSDLKGTGHRFAHTMAIAPNATTSIICSNTSPGIEPFQANIYKQQTLSGVFFNHNPYLEQVLENHGRNDEETWNLILENGGSVQHLGFLTEREKEIFKTFIELNQADVVQAAADRQPYIDQAQSVNLKFPPDAEKNTLHQVHKKAWQEGLKTLYYCRSSSMVNNQREKNNDIDCVGCSD